MDISKRKLYEGLNPVSYELEEIDEYIVTLKNKEDLDQFYDDLETPGGPECVPDRCVECALRRDISRNTHYYLSQEEVETLKQDERVLDIIPRKLRDSAYKQPRGWTENTSGWNKSSSVVNTHRNWGLLRCIEGQQQTNWGTDGNPAVTGIVTATSSGKNVDAIIIDGFINPNHPEMAVNADGTGGTRVVQFNWGSLNSIAGHGSNNTYTYPSTYTAYGDDHGQHVAGTVAGNSQGWARDANIYNIYVYGDGQPAGDYPFDYARAFHLTKAVNPDTGLRNPTIINNSWGYGLSVVRSSITSIVWRGTTYSGAPTDSQLQSYGIVPAQYDSTTVYVEGWFESDVADIQDAISDGVIIVGAAGNASTKIDVPGGQDYDNRINTSSQTLYYHRGSVNSSASTAICVGCVGALKNDSKATFSNTGPRVTIYAPGSNIISSVHSGPASDYRNSTYKIAKYSGTSMASPNVCGVIACALEQYPRMDNAAAIEYIQGLSKSQVFEPTVTTYTDQGVSSISNTASPLTGTTSFVPAPNTSVRINSTSGAATLTPIANNLLGAASLTADTTATISHPTYGGNDDGWWLIGLPFNYSYNGVSDSILYVNSNSYVLFGSSPPSASTYDESINWTYNTTTPTIPKIQISTADGSLQRLYYGAEGSAPNRTYRIRFEGHTSYTGGVLGSPTLVWEMVFYENTPAQIDLHMGVNPRVTSYNAYLDYYNLQGSTNRYLFYRQDRPVKGTLLPRVGERVRKTSGQTWPRMGTLKYKQ